MKSAISRKHSYWYWSCVLLAGGRQILWVDLKRDPQCFGTCPNRVYKYLRGHMQIYINYWEGDLPVSSILVHCSLHFTQILIFIYWGGVRRVQLERRPLLAYCTSPVWWMMTSVEPSVERLARDVEVLGGNLPQCHYAHHKSHMT
jgi:hypothetical protein